MSIGLIMAVIGAFLVWCMFSYAATTVMFDKTAPFIVRLGAFAYWLILVGCALGVAGV